MRKLVILLPLLLALCGACSNNTPNSGNTTGSDTTSGSEDTTDGTSASGGDGGSGSTGDVTTPSCGNGISEAGEECDDGNEIESDACLNNCKAAQCGDGIVQTGIETCDDGNKIENDGCNNNCQPINVSHLWSLSFGDEQDQLSTDIAVDHEDNVVIAGIFKSSIVFGDTVLKSTFPFDYDFFIAKFDPTGKILWSKSFGDVLYELEVFIAIDPNNQIYLSGNSLGPVDFLDGNSLEVGNGSYTGSFLTKLDQNGQYLWGKAFPPAANSKSKRVWDISVDSTGQPTIAGFFEGTTNFDGADLIDQGKGDQFIAKFDSLGNPLWSRAFGNSSSYKSTSIHLASHGEDTFFTSEIEGAVDFGSGVVLDTGAQDYCDVLIVKLNGKGEAQWAKNFGDDGYQRGN